MTTKKPRITITLEPYPYEVLRSMSESSGQTMSGIITGMVDMSLPVLERMAATYQQVKRSGDIERGRIAEAMQEAQDAFEPLVMSRIAQQDLFLMRSPVAASVEASGRNPEGRAPEPIAAAASPPTNRGVTPDRTNNLQPKNGKGLKGVLKKQVSKKVDVSNGHNSGLCTCTITKHERMENKTCPVHSKGDQRHAV